MRTAVRLKLSSHSEVWKLALAKHNYLEIVQRASGALLMDIVPLLSAPPRFVFQPDLVKFTTPWQNRSKSSVAGIDRWLRRFYRKERIDRLWKASRNQYKSSASYLQQFARLLVRIGAPFTEPSSELEIILLPNLLDSRGRGYSLSSSRKTWLFLGPALNRSQTRELVIHELLHRWVDPIANKVVEPARKSEGVRLARARYPMVAQAYPDPTIWVGETVVRAATVWLSRRSTSKAKQIITQHESQGFVGVRDAYDFLVHQDHTAVESIWEAVDIVNKTVTK